MHSSSRKSAANYYWLRIMGWGAGGACNQPLHLRLCKVKLVATFLDASDCFSRSLQYNIIGKENNLLQEDLLITHQNYV